MNNTKYKSAFEYALEKLNNEELLDVLSEFAKENHDGHFTIFSFTTVFKVVFGTPYIMPLSKAYEKLFNLPTGETIREAVIRAILYQPAVYS